MQMTLKHFFNPQIYFNLEGPITGINLDFFGGRRIYSFKNCIAKYYATHVN